MEQTSQLEPAAPETLHEELAKWRERVPRLAAALRQRTVELEALKRQLDASGNAPSSPNGAGADIRARDELIAELEAKLSDLGQRHKAAEAELHRRALEVEELERDLGAWKQKWQAATRALDEQAAASGQEAERLQALEDANQALERRLAEQSREVDTLRRARDEAVAEHESFAVRNEQLFETTELANRQIASLTDSLAELRANLKRHREREAELDARHAELEQRLAEVSESRDRAEGEVAGLQEHLDEQQREVTRLTDVVALAQRATDQREQERRELSERLQAAEDRAAHLESQLRERSALVVTLEQDQAEAARAREALQQERDDLEAALMRAERHAKETTEHVAQLDGKLERQKELMEGLEAELAEARQSESRRRPAASEGDAGETARLQEQVRKLQALVRERTEALNRLEWERRLVAEERHPEREPAGDGDTTAAECDAKSMLVLSQQLADARDRNEELVARVRRLETELAEKPRAQPGSGDDLTRIHGVGQKLAEQLNDLGIHHLRQIAELDATALADEDHVLHAHRARILRDGWIDQAVKLISH